MLLVNLGYNQELPILQLLLLLGVISSTLDGLEVGVCAFDDADRALLWNRTFLRLFPEHSNHVHSGEPYEANLRRFYAVLLDKAEMPFIERYIEEGIKRDRQQTRPFIFEHHGREIRASALPLPGGGRIRMWKVESDGSASSVAAPLVAGLAHLPTMDFSALLVHLADGLMVTDAAQRILWANDAFLATYRFNGVGDLAGQVFERCYRRAWGTALSNAELSRFESGMAVLFENFRFVGAPFELPLPQGRWVRVIQQRGPDGFNLSTHVDITELKRQQQELQAAEERARQSNTLLEATLERMQQGVMMVNADQIVEVCNRRAIELLELPESLMNSKPSFEQVLAYQWSTDEFSQTSQSIQDFVRAGGIKDQPEIYDRRRPNGRVIEVQSVPIAGGGVLRTYTDITERKLAEERVRHAARHDGLTSLENREVFLEHVARAFERAVEDPSRRFAVHFIDLDRFKPINDRHGHAVGDKLLTIVSKRMRRTAREGDVVARIGGDEFGVLQHGVDADAALGFGQRLRACVSEPMEINALQVYVGASIGIALYPGPAIDADALLRNADHAMYDAKSRGGQSVQLFER